MVERLELGGKGGKEYRLPCVLCSKRGAEKNIIPMKNMSGPSVQNSTEYEPW